MPPIRAAERRREQNRADARRTILDAAESLLLEVGHDGFSIRRLVERCGYSAPTLYHYFGGKTGLVEALLEERLLAELLERLRAVPFFEDPLEEAHARTEAFACWGIERPTQYRLLMLPRGENANPLPSGEEAMALMQSPHERLVEAGRLAAEDVEALGQAVWACMHGLISLQALRPDVEWAPDIIERSIAAVFRGWLDDTDASPRAVTGDSRPAASSTPRPSRDIPRRDAKEAS